MAKAHIAPDGDIGPLSQQSLGSASTGVSTSSLQSFASALHEFDAALQQFDRDRNDVAATVAAIHSWLFVAQRLLTAAEPLLAQLRLPQMTGNTMTSSDLTSSPSAPHPSRLDRITALITDISRVSQAVSAIIAPSQLPR